MQIRPIRTDKDHRAALAEIEKLWGASSGTPEGDKLDILVTLVETYEERRWPPRSRRRFDPVDVLRYAIEELGHSQAELADILGSRSRASEVLARRRPLTLEMIQKINASWKIPADLLVQALSGRRNGSLSGANDARSHLRSSRSELATRALGTNRSPG
jgi:HTH-type transcriptional regulator / antitoxin HigA